VHAPPLPDARVIEQQAAELAALRAQLAQLGAVRGGDPPRNAPAPAPGLPVLFANPEAVDRARAAAVAARDGDKKPALPDIVPGFKANSLDVREYQSPLSRFSFSLSPLPVLSALSRVHVRSKAPQAKGLSVGNAVSPAEQ
jgi:hypothetical protein